jgi:hypothetical protein
MYLEELGMTRRMVYQRCMPDGPWRRLLPGIVLLNRAEPTVRQRFEAALLHGGKGAMVTGLSAAGLHGLRAAPEPTPVHVLTPASREVISTGFVVVERTTRMPEPQLREGLSVAPPHRAVLDGVRRLSDFDRIQAILSEAVQRRRCTAQDLAAELKAGSQRGSALPRRALAALLDGAHSVAEADAWLLWQRSGLPAAQRNVKIFDAKGNYIATPDTWCDDVAFAWEIDSRGHHAEGDDFAGTLARNARYTAVGIVFLQTLPARLRTEPDKVRAELWAAYETARRRPRPDIRLG